MKATSDNSERGRNSKLIVSRDNSLLRQTRVVRDGKDETLIFVEGLRLCEEALRSGLEIHAVVYSKEIAHKERAAALLTELANVCKRLGEVSESLLATVSYTKTPQGLIVLAERPVSGKERLAPTKGQQHLLVIMDGINNPVNVGAIIRSAEAAGATGVVTTGDSSDPFSPKALRGAMGSAFRLPIWNGPGYPEALAWCARHQIKTICTDVKATKLHTEIDWKGPCALILGSESSGLAAEQVQMAAAEVKIPMHGSVESLNVGVAAAVILYEAARQRNI
ncbi:MAG: RNA methyltransferase [Acidobacteriota bacterium]|nr:RNA methyltransferase [Acidobacteriota bacterium]